MIVRRLLLALVCLLIAAARVFWPEANLDFVTIALLVVAALLILSPDFSTVLPYIKRLNFFGAEVELWEKIGEAGKSVELAQEAAGVGLPDDGVEVAALVRDAATDPRAALLLLSTRIEERLHRLARSLDLLGPRPQTGVVVRSLVSADALPEEFVPAFQHFWALRNQVAHFDPKRMVTDSQALASLAVGVGVLRMIPEPAV